MITMTRECDSDELAQRIAIAAVAWAGPYLHRITAAPHLALAGISAHEFDGTMRELDRLHDERRRPDLDRDFNDSWDHYGDGQDEQEHDDGRSDLDDDSERAGDVGEPG